MTQSLVYTQKLSECHDTSAVGGKAANLGRLIRDGFPVPTGFVVQTSAYLAARQLQPDGALEIPKDVADAVRQAYQTMGGGMVAVRSSATAEDMAAASMAGQYETFLSIEGEDALLDALRRCWASLDTPRIRAYLAEHKIDPAHVAMAVVVQRLVSADVAGVLFTANPNASGRREMLLEASWGLGESVVSGRVQPDVLRLDQESGRVIEATIADKQVLLTAGSHEEKAVEESRRRAPCLKTGDVHRLWQLGTRILAHFGMPQDIEWAIKGGELFLLQSRPITTREEAESYEELLRSTRAQLRLEIGMGHGPWAIHNLAETLPHPTPLTWSVIKTFMSGEGGFGAMYRQVGFEPSAAVGQEGFLELIGGRIYMDAARAPEMFFEKFPFAYDVAELKKSPNASQSPPTVPRGTLVERRAVGRRLRRVNAKLRALSEKLDRELWEGQFPEITRYVVAAKKAGLRALSIDALIARWHEVEKRVLGVFGPATLMPSLITGMAMSELRTFLEENFWREDVDELVQMISAGGMANRTMTADAELYEVGQGTCTLDKWIGDHGHRATGELDLAAPRWREQPALAQEMAGRLFLGGESPLERHHRTNEGVTRRIASLRDALSRGRKAEFDRRVRLLLRYIPFREDGKDFLMLGYDLLRDLALEIGRWLEIGEDVFYLTREDCFDALRVGFAPLHLIELRKATYKAEEKLRLPPVIDAAVIESLGERVEIKNSGGGNKAFAISSGEARGPARILHSPSEAGELGTGYILICPSTDPSWTPLFMNAAGLVLECGGTLSHGAVVAREMGLPAVVLPDATRRFQEGENLRINGTSGWVRRVEEEMAAMPGAELSTATEVDPDNMHIMRELIPPPPGYKDRSAGKLRNHTAIFWAIFLLGFFVLPDRFVHDPVMTLMDALLWPLVGFAGKPGSVAIVAAGIAFLTLLLQKLFTDNERLLEAKRRAAGLARMANGLPRESPRRAALLRAAAPVQIRTLMAALVPVGLLLGPMVMPFMWFKDRVESTAWNVPAGTPVQIVAMVDSDWPQPVTIELPPGMQVDESTTASRTLPPLRGVLEHLLALYRVSRNESLPWEMKAAPDVAREQTIADLQKYLEAGIPPQGITWLVRPEAGVAGRFSITVRAGDKAPVPIPVVLGDAFPPGVTRVSGAAGGPVREVRIVYPKPAVEAHFWQPLRWMQGQDKTATGIAGLDVGWVWVYILAYFPALYLIRAMLRVA